MTPTKVLINLLLAREPSINKWSTMAGSFSTSCEAKVNIKLPDLNVTAHILAPFYITDQKAIMM